MIIDGGAEMSYTVYKEAPPVILEFLHYIGNIKGRSDLTVDEYYRDLRTFFRFIIKDCGLVKKDIPVDEIDISSVDLEMVSSVTFSEIILFLNYCKDDRKNAASTKARKTTTLRDFFHYLTVKVHKLKLYNKT